MIIAALVAQAHRGALEISTPMAYMFSAMWAPDSIRFDDIDYDATDHPVVTIRIATPAGMVEMMAEAAQRGRSLRLRRLHVQSAVDPNTIGFANWRLEQDRF